MGAVDGGFVRSGAIFELAKKGGGKGLGRGRIVQEFVAKNCGVELKTNCLRVGLRVSHAIVVVTSASEFPARSGTHSMKHVHAFTDILTLRRMA